jgi:hypothetical protein
LGVSWTVEQYLAVVRFLHFVEESMFQLKYFGKLHDLYSATRVVSRRKRSRRLTMTPTLTPYWLLRFLVSGRQRRAIEQAGGEVARACHASLWREIEMRTSLMSVAEIRGYVRAFAQARIVSEVEASLQRRGLDRSLRPSVADMAVEQLIAMVVHDVLCAPTAAPTRSMAA